MSEVPYRRFSFSIPLPLEDWGWFMLTIAPRQSLKPEKDSSRQKAFGRPAKIQKNLHSNPFAPNFFRHKKRSVYLYITMHKNTAGTFVFQKGNF